MKKVLMLIMLIMLIMILSCFGGCSVRKDNDDKVYKTDSDDNAHETNTTDDTTEADVQIDVDISTDWVVIALLDTGVSSTAITSDKLLSGYNYVTNEPDTEDKINHGTAVASIISGCESAGIEAKAKEAYIVPLVVVTKENGKVVSASTEDLARAIYDSVDKYNADIINVSLGVLNPSQELYDAIKYAYEKGVLVVSAVGNDGKGGNPYYPAAYDETLAVGSCDENGDESDFSQNGADVLAMGEDIWLASRNGKTYGARGTSYATGFVTATAAKLLLEDKDLTLQELREGILEKYKEK